MAPLTDQDLELLSAYLDDQLTEAERTVVESRLHAEPDLSRELEALRATVSLIRALPAVKAPRDYTLDARAARPGRLWIFPAASAFSAISAAAATLLVVLGVVTLLSSNLPSAAPLESAQQVAAQPTHQLTQTPAAASNAAAVLPTVEPARASASEPQSKLTMTSTALIEEQEAAAEREAPGALALPASPPQESPASSVTGGAAAPTAEADFFAGAEAPAPEATMLADAALAQAAQPTLTTTPRPTSTHTSTAAPSPTRQPTAALMPTPAPEPEAPAGPSVTGSLMVIAGLVLMALAILTSLARRTPR